MPNREPSEFANRLAGWFFVVFGVGLLLFAAAVGATWAPDTPTFIWILALAGLASVLFGVFATRSVRATVLDFMANFFWVF